MERRRSKGKFACLVLVFVGALLAGALLHTNLPAPRRWIRDAVNAALRPLPQAKVEIGEITRLTPWGAVVRSIDVDMPGSDGCTPSRFARRSAEP